jgi:hypothetical protein
MKFRFLATSHVLGGTALLCAAAMLPGTALAATATPASSVKAGVVTAAAAGAVLAELSASSHAHTSPPASTPGMTATTTKGNTRGSHPSWNIPRCKAHQTEIWMGIPGSGAAGTIFYPLQFTNISKHACKIWGFSRVTARGKGRQIGKAARRVGKQHVVELWPGQTAHARLGIIEAGNVCSKPVWANGLKVRAPHQGRSTVIPFSFQACWHKRVLVVGAVKPGVGIP